MEKTCWWNKQEKEAYKVGLIYFSLFFLYYKFHNLSINIRIIYVECYDSPKDQSKFFSYKGRPAAHFPLNFQLVGLKDNQNKTSIISNSSTVRPFEPFTLKKLIDEWNKCKKKQSDENNQPFFRIFFR